MSRVSYDSQARTASATGVIADTVTGLTYLGARYFDSLTSRFLSPDPLMNPMDPKTLDAYMYSNDNPVTFSDASGLYAQADEQVCGHYGCVGATTDPNTVGVGLYGYGTPPSAGGTGSVGGPGGKAKSSSGGSQGAGNSLPLTEWFIDTFTTSSATGGSGTTGTTGGSSPGGNGLPYTHAGYSYGPEDFKNDASYGAYIWRDLQKQPSPWSHWNDSMNLGVEYRALENAYVRGGGHTYVGGPICGVYAVCVTGVSWVTDGTAITFGRVILAKEDTIGVWKQFHEYGHAVDYADVGADRFGRDYAWAKATAFVHRGGERPDDGNWLEKSANTRADAAITAWDAAGGSDSEQAGPRLLPDTVKDVFGTSSYSAPGAG